jgi:ABC-type transporter Mla subunit MlaD
MTEDDVSYEIIPVTPIKKLEERIEKIESSGSTPQLQNLINQIIELIRNNQKIVNDVIQANNDLRNELSKLPSKMDELIDTINGFLELVEAAGKEEINAVSQPVQPNADAFKPIIDELKKISDQNQKLVESNQVVLDELNKMDRKLKGGMPVSTLLSNYPLKKEVKRFEQL